MSTAPIHGTIQIANKTAAEWTAQNPVLLAGQLGLETDTRKLKAGNGNTEWNLLGYTSGPEGSISTYTDLADAENVALPTLNVPLAAALVAQSAYADSRVQVGAILASPTLAPNATATIDAVAAKAGLAATAIPYGTVIPLDAAGPGKIMPQTQLVASSVFTVGPVTADGACQLCLIGDGTHSPDLSAFTNGNGYTYVATANTRNFYVFGYQFSTAMFAGVNLGSVDITAPTLSSAAVADATSTQINLVWNEPIFSTISAAAAFAVSSGHTVSSHTYVDTTHTTLTVTPAFVQGEARTLAYTQPGSNKMQDLAGNLLVNFSGTTITNNVTTPTLVSANVANATPGRIDLSWSETISSTIPAFSTFAVSSGHTLTAHTYLDATHTYLTTSTNFVAAETKTLSYTPSGTNDMADQFGNKVAAFSGTAITDSVGGTHAVLIQSSGVQKLINGAGLNFNMGSPMTGGAAMVICIASFKDITGPTNVQVNDVYATQVAAKQSVAFPNYWVYCYLAQGYTGGTTAITISTSGGSYLTLSATEWSGFQASAADVTANNLTSGTSLTVTSGATSQANELIFAVASESNAFTGTLTGPTGYTVDLNYAGVDDVPLASGYKQVTATGAQTAVFSESSSNELYGVIATFKTT